MRPARVFIDMKVVMIASTLLLGVATNAHVAGAQSSPPTVADKGSTKTGNKTPASTASNAPAGKETSVMDALKHSADKHGLWGSIGIGRAKGGLDCDACADAATRAYSIHGDLGIRVTPRFLIGAETFAWLDVFGGGVDRVARGTYLLGRAYMFGKSKVFLQGGLGVASFRITDDEVGFRTRSPSLSLSGGFDWRLAGLTVTPAVSAIMTTGGKLTSSRTENAIDEHARLGLLRTSIALSWFR